MSDSTEPYDPITQAQAALEQATQALARAAAALAQVDRGAVPDRRQRVRLKPEPRVTEPDIDRLGDLDPASTVSVQKLATYWGAHDNNILYWIRTGRLPAMKEGRSYRVPVREAIAFERILYRQRDPA